VSVGVCVSVQGLRFVRGLLSTEHPAFTESYVLYMKLARRLVSDLLVCNLRIPMHLGIWVQVAPRRGVTRSASGSACFRWEEHLSIVTTTQPEMLTSVPSTSIARLLVWPAVGCAPSGPTADPTASAILPRRRPFAWCSVRNNR